MKFELKHDIHRGISFFTSENPPDWLIGRENKWFFDRQVLTLKVGQEAKTDFNTIKRIA